MFAADDETVLIIEAKSTITKNKSCNFKKDLEAIGYKKAGLIDTIKKEYPNHKIKFIFATNNYNIGEQDKIRMKEFNIFHFDEDKLSYFTELANHLGYSARYQLLGALFEGQTIQGMNNIVPAISGKMGGHKYYLFSIEPEKLLKLGYVLHRNDSNRDSLPTYQRLIKKGRLKKVHEFIENGGYFPNSVIVNINTNKKALRFDQAKQGNSDSLSKIGLLYLPQKYKSIYIIDGQHRLYGYSDSDFKSSNTIPVVAFENLDKNEQVKIFMDINENQKAVPKNLRNTLNEDLKYNSEDPKERREALTLRISRELGEDRNSPLYDRIIIGENISTPECCITLETLSKAINSGKFLSKYKKKTKYEEGFIDFDDNDTTFQKLYPLLLGCFKHLKNGIGDEEWIKNNDNKNSFVKNNIISGIIRTINSIIIYLKSENLINPLANSVDNMLNTIKPYLNVIIDYWNTMTDEEKKDINSTYGANGPINCCRHFEKNINSHFSNFNPDGLKEYWNNRDKNNANEAREIIDNLLATLRSNFKLAISSKFNENQLDKWLPKSVSTTIDTKVSNYNYGKDKHQFKDRWDFFEFDDLQKILTYSSNWTEIFNKKYSHPDIRGNKETTTKWLIQINTINKQLRKSSFIDVDDFEYIKVIDKWIKSI